MAAEFLREELSVYSSHFSVLFFRFIFHDENEDGVDCGCVMSSACIP